MPTETITGDTLSQQSHGAKRRGARDRDCSDSPATWGWAPLPCHPDVLLQEPLLQDSATAVTFQLWMLALHVCALSKDSSGFGLQPSQCLQNSPVKKKKDIQIIRLFYKSLSLLFSSDSYGFYTTTCMLVSCWFFLPSSLSLKKNPKKPQCQKPSLPSPGRVPSLILARYVYTDYALQ